MLSKAVLELDDFEGLQQAAGDERRGGNSSLLIRGTARSALNWPVRVWAAVDAFVAAVSFSAGHILSPWYRSGLRLDYSLMAACAIFATALVAWNYVLGMYDRHNFASRTRIVGFSALAAALALASTSLVFGWLDYSHIGRYILLNTFGLSLIALVIVRVAARELARRAKIRVLFVGRRWRFRPLERELAHLYGPFYHTPLYVEGYGGGHAMRSDLLKTFYRSRPDEIVVEDDDATILSVLKESPDILRHGCAIYSYGDYFEALLRQIPVDSIDYRGVLGHGLKVSGPAALAKRPLDILLAGVGLILGAPFTLIVAALVKMTSPGPVIYKQVRVGRYGRPFSIYKFRTMRQDAERDGAVWAKTRDSRVTAVGAILRRTRVDELPQLWNILRGDMSFVGPRPERPEFVRELAEQIPHYEMRHLVPPGLTGWAQVSYRYGASVEDARRKLAYDLYYVRHYGPMFDLGVCMRTLAAMAKGAR